MWKSVPTSGGCPPAVRDYDLPLYFNPPGFITPVSTAPTVELREVKHVAAQCGFEPVECTAASPDVVYTTIAFEVNVASDYRICCDLNGDGVYDFISDDDLVLTGTTVVGNNTVMWDGKNNGVQVGAGTYNCKAYILIAEIHFPMTDIETMYPGLRMFSYVSDTDRRPERMYWSDDLIQDNAINMPNGQKGLESSGPSGFDSGPYSDATSANVNARAWGNFANGGKGNNAILDTYALVEATSTNPFPLEVAAASDFSKCNSDILLSVAVFPSDEGDSGDTVVSINVSATTPAGSAFTLEYASIDGTAVEGEDYVGQNVTVSIPPGTVCFTVDFVVNGDTKFENDENFTVQFRALESNVNFTTTVVQVDILNDDVLPTAAFFATAIATTEANVDQNITARLSLSRSSAWPITLQYMTMDGTALSAIDYVAVPVTTVTIPPDSTFVDVDITIVGDNVLEDPGTETFQILGWSVEPGIVFLGDNVTVTITDEDTTPGIFITGPADLSTTTEAGGALEFVASPSLQPTDPITLPFSTDGTEATVTPASLVWNSGDWDTPKTFTVTGVDDPHDDGDVTYVVLCGPVSSSDALYHGGWASRNLTLVNSNDDTAAITVSLAAGSTSEAGGTTTFTVVLTAEPINDVTVTVASSDVGEGTVAPASHVFNSGNWNSVQTFTVTGVDDDVDDGDVAFSVTVGASSVDPAYSTVTPSRTSVPVVNLDDDDAGIAASGLNPVAGTTEGGGTSKFTVVLQSEPTQDVTVPISATPAAEVAASTASLTFTSGNWNTPQTVTLTGQNDDVDDGDQAITVNVGPATSTDGVYSGMAVVPAVLSANNADDDTAALVLSAVSGPTTEAGGTATFTVKLASEPTGTVTVPVASLTTSEGTVGASPLTFTAGNWATAQTVTITGVDDLYDDGDVAYTIQLGSTTSTDPNYDSRTRTRAVTNNDDDTAAVTYSGASGTTTTEAGQARIFTVVLGCSPAASTTVTCAFASSDTSEGTVSAASVVFDDTDWNVVRTVTVTGVDDAVDDGNVAYQITSGAATSADPAYSGLAPTWVSLPFTNTDDDTAGVQVTQSPATLTTTEAGATKKYTVVLTSEPVADVTVESTSTDVSEGTAAPQFLTFTTGNWNVAQTVTVTGVDDDVVDGNVAYTVDVHDAVSTDPLYSALAPSSDVSCVNNDDDVASIVLAPTSLLTTESGGDTTILIRLGSMPASQVDVAVTSTNTAEGTVSPASLTFLTGNWNTDQTVTVTGVDDVSADGDQAYDVQFALTSADGLYNGMSQDVAMTNQDDDQPGVSVTAISGTTKEAAPGTPAVFYVSLGTVPSADVTIPLTSSNTQEGTVVASVTITPATWNSATPVNVYGVDDDVDDGNQVYKITCGAATSSDGTYNGLTPDSPNVTVTNVDDDTAGISLALATAGADTTTEGGTTVAIEVVLDSEPTADVTLGVASDDTTEGTVSAATLTFTAADWDTPQTVTVTGVDDDADDGDVAYNVVVSVAASADGIYAALPDGSVGLTNADDDVSDVVVSLPAPSTTTEAGGTATFTVQLASQPTVDVVLPVAAVNPTTLEGSVTPASVTFTSANWDTPVVITAQGLDDDVADGVVAWQVSVGPASAGDASYLALPAESVALGNVDDDTARISVSAPAPVFTTEGAGQAVFTVHLESKPTANVAVGLSLDAAGVPEATLSNTSLTFTPTSWAAAQSVTVTGVDDDVDDGDISYTVLVGDGASADPNYNGLAPTQDVDLYNEDDDVASIVTSAPAPGTITEAGSVAELTVAITSRPLSPVTVSLTSTDTGEMVVLNATLVFPASASWSTVQTVSLQGVDDDVDDGSQSSSVTFSVTTTDPLYSALPAPVPVAISTTDDDTKGVDITLPPFVTTTEGGGSASVSLRLRSQPLADVVVALSSSDTAEATVSVPSVTFTTANWATPVAVTVVGVDDDVDDGDVAYTVSFGPVTSADAAYNGLVATPASVAATNTDDDTAAVVVSAPSGPSTSEAGSSVTFSVSLASKPTADVVIPAIVSSNPLEGVPDVSSLTFTTATWSTPQTVTVTGVDDDMADSTVAYVVSAGPATSTDLKYAGKTIAPVPLSNLDDDAAGLVLAGTLSPTLSEFGTSEEFTVALTSQPLGPTVVFAVLVSDPAEVEVDPASLTFTPGDWSTPQTVTLTGKNDFVADGTQPFSVTFGPAASAQSDYSALIFPQVVSGLNMPMNSPEFVITPNAPYVVEEDNSTTLLVSLSNEPSAVVVVPILSLDTTEVLVSVATLIFSPTNWSAAQQLVLVGVDDGVGDGDMPVQIRLGPCVTTDPGYSGMTETMAVTSVDEFRPEVVVTVLSNFTSENGTTASLALALVSMPTASVSIDVTVPDSSEGRVLSDPTVVFTNDDYADPHVVVIQGVADGVEDGDVPFDVVFAPADSEDDLWDGVVAPAVTLTNLNIRVPAITSVSPGVSPALGGVEIVVTGERFDAGMAVYLAVDIDTFTHTSSTSFSFMAPAQNFTDVYYDLIVTNIDGGRGVRGNAVFFTNDCPYEGMFGRGTDCEECPECGYCPGGYRICPLEGCWNEGIDSGAVAPCSPESRCLGGCNSTCASGYQGRFCAECQDEHYREGDECLPCVATEESSPYAIVVVFFLLDSVLTVTTILGSGRAVHLVGFGLLTLQYVFAVGAMAPSTTPDLLKGVYLNFGTFSFDVSLLKTGCTIGSSSFSLVFYLSIALYGLMSIINVIGIGTISLFQLRVLPRSHVAKLFKQRLGRAMSLLASLEYFNLTVLAIKVVRCVETPFGTVMETDGSVACHTGEHVAMFWVAVVVLAAFSFGTLAFAIARQLRRREHLVTINVKSIIEERRKAAYLKSVETGYAAALMESHLNFFKDEEKWWFAPAWLLLMATLAVSAGTLQAFPLIRLIVNLVALVAYLAVCVVGGPYLVPWRNTVSAITLCFCLVCVVFNYLATEGSGVPQNTLNGLSYGVLGLLGITLVVIFFFIIKGARRQAKGEEEGEAELIDDDVGGGKELGVNVDDLLASGDVLASTHLLTDDPVLADVGKVDLSSVLATTAAALSRSTAAAGKSGGGDDFSFLRSSDQLSHHTDEDYYSDYSSGTSGNAPDASQGEGSVVSRQSQSRGSLSRGRVPSFHGSGLVSAAARMPDEALAVLNRARGYARGVPPTSGAVEGGEESSGTWQGEQTDVHPSASSGTIATESGFSVLTSGMRTSPAYRGMEDSYEEYSTYS